MSGITAIFDGDGSIAHREVDEVLDALAHRGWDGTGTEVRDRVALGHQHSYTTPEAVGERQPVALDDLWITFDGRIDNRGELLDLFAEVGESTTPRMSDAELVLRAYRALGEEFLDRLVGAFALALWDPGDDRLLVARDKTGIRKLYYAETDTGAVVASEMQAVGRHPAVSTEINDGFVAEFMVSRTITQGETFYADVREVEPGSLVEVTPDGTRAESYWKPWNADLDLDGSTDVVEEFRDRLQEAVACRLRSRELPGILLSGGLDSTTIACFVRRHLDAVGGVDDDFHSFSFVMDDVDYFQAEIERLDAVVEQCDVESHRIYAAEHYPLKDIDVYETAARESPGFGALESPSWTLLEEAKAVDRNVMLAGAGGNVFDGNRFYYLDLLRRGRLDEFVRQARADPIQFRKLLLWFVLVPSSDRIAEFARRRYDDDADGPELPAWLSEEFVEGTGLADRLVSDVETGFDSTARELMFKQFHGTARKFEDAIERQRSLRAGVELRLPYLDSRLWEFLFSVPSWETFDAGEDKSLFRRATKGILPEKVRTQHAAVHFGPVMDRGVKRERRAYVEDLFADSRLVERGIADEEAFEAHVAAALDDDDDEVDRNVWQLVATEIWLRQQSAAASGERRRPAAAD